MKKILILSAMLVVLALPTFAAYQVSWTENFDSLAAGSISGQHGWYTPGTIFTSGSVVNDRAVSGTQSYKQGAVGTVLNANNMQALSSGNLAYKKGSLRAWVYDPGGAATDTRVGVFTTTADSAIGSMFTANITYRGTAGSSAWWRCQWSYSAINMDGTNSATAAGFTFTPGVAAPRTTDTWNNVRIDWNYTYPVMSAKPSSASIKWWINRAPNNEFTLDNYSLALSVDSTSTRWSLLGLGIKGVMMGVPNSQSSVGGNIDNVEFKGNVIPEPTSLLALGTGLVGLMGLIRRKR